jgi:hypothetical protein
MAQRKMMRPLVPDNATHFQDDKEVRAVVDSGFPIFIDL